MTHVRLLATTLDDRRRVYDWMTSPGIVERMMGPPDFPDSEVPTYEEFVEDWLPHAYEKAGFERWPMNAGAAARHFRTEADYDDAVFLVARVAPSRDGPRA